MPPSQYQEFYKSLSDSISWPSVLADSPSSISIPPNGASFFSEAQLFFEKEAKGYNNYKQEATKSRSDIDFSVGKLFKLYTLRTKLKIWRESQAENIKISEQALDLIDYSYNKCFKQCKLIVAYIPNSVYWRPQEDGPIKLFSEAIRNSDYDPEYFAYLDMTPVLNALGLDAYAPEGGHLSPKGYKAVANSISPSLNN